LGLGVVFLLVGLGLNFSGRYQNEDVVVTTVVEGEEVAMGEVAREGIVVEIAGEVMWPGVYEMNKGDRVMDVLVKSGGLSKEADRDWVEKSINRARKLKDGEKVYIPKMGEVPEKVLGDVDNGMGLVNLNTAGEKELETLVGIGPSLAGRIVEYREAKDEFKDINELKLVKGIGEAVFEQIKDKIEV